MPLFTMTNGLLVPVQQTNFDTEKQLQLLVEASLQPIFNCRLVASEFGTGSQHGGRIDTLALSEDHNPVIVEYKKIESSELINQSLFYLSWIHDHRGDFHIAAQQALGASVEIVHAIREFVMGLDPAMEEAPKKFYVAYRISQNITCLEVQKQRCLLFVKVDPASVGPLPTFARDVRAIGHYGTGDLELSIR